jgi:ATP synthase protein I
MVAWITERHMASPEETREEAIRRLQQSAGALEARTAPPPAQDHGTQAASYGYRLMGLLLGGVFVGLGFGAAVDAIAKTGPWGMIIGVLVGFAVSIWLTVRSAKRMSDELARDLGPAKDLGPDDDEDD